ncbi:MAG: YciI family protein [Myxococcota bacterium]
MAKNRYLVLARTAPSSSEGGPKEGPSPEQMQQMMAKYEAWMTKFADRIEDRGNRLKGTGRVVSASGVADGPFVEAKELIGGYMILKADSYEEAVEVIQAGPMLGGPALFEVRELAEM